MYRPGFGDCFLLSFGSSTTRRHVLVDFGAHMHGEIGTMDAIMEDIEKVTRRKLLLLVATHAHRDHISGFGKFASRFAKFDIDEVWLPWTDNPEDPEVDALQKKQHALYDRLEDHLRSVANSATAQGSPEYAAALDALANLRGNEEATTGLRRGFDTGARVRYLHGGMAGETIGEFKRLSMDILGPPKDKSALRRMDPPADQRFLTAPGDSTGTVRPFPDLEIVEGSPDYAAILNDDQPILTPAEMQRLHTAVEAPAARLALALDSVRNNTSLVILFRFDGKTLLFPGDAQWGNWQSWINTDRGNEILGQVDFLKVAHHGSHNATPVDVVNALRKSATAVVPTQVKPFPTIPRLPLLQALRDHCGHVAVRSDWVLVPGAPEGPPMPRLPPGFTIKDNWIDYTF